MSVPSKPLRPKGVSVLGYLFYITGILGLIGGILLTAAMALLFSLTPQFGGAISSQTALFAGISLVLGVILVVLGPLYIRHGRGLLKLRPGARKWAIRIAVIGLIVDIIQIGAAIAIDPTQVASNVGLGGIYVVLNLIIIAYLQKSSIKQYFAAPQPTPPS